MGVSDSLMTQTLPSIVGGGVVLGVTKTVFGGGRRRRGGKIRQRPATKKVPRKIATKNHYYFVEWSAPDYRNSKSTTVLAANQPDAIKCAKKKLGVARIKKQFLHSFRAFRVSTTGYHKQTRRKY